MTQKILSVLYHVNKRKMKIKKKQYTVLENGDNLYRNNKHKFAMKVLMGLTGKLKKLPTEYIYDEKGSKLFKEIMELPEYYLTNSEKKVLLNNKKKLRERINGNDINLIELGAGDGIKTKIIIDDLIKNEVIFKYIPIDISPSAIIGLLDNFYQKFPQLNIEGVVSDYFSGLKWLSNLSTKQNLVLFLGSNIGNFSREQINTFLSSLWQILNEGDLILIGFDLKKDIKKMIKAYNDSKGVTAQFNLNLLERINSELRGNFETEKFQFYSTYDVSEGAIMSYLISVQRQTVFIEDLKRSFNFNEWEPVHTESSYKFNIEDIERLAEQNNFAVVEHYFDTDKQFTDSLWRVQKK